MICVNPRRLPNPAATSVYDYYNVTSCGKCYACLANRRRSWHFRLMNESLNSVITLFVTFTYDDLHVLKSRSPSSQKLLCKPHLQKFFKRLRHYEDFVHYSIGEYGTNTLRPHYHSVIFFKSAPFQNPLDELTYLISKLWPYGFVSVSRASYRRLNYVLHYHVRPKKVGDGLETFQIFSKGLGLDFLDDNMIDYLVQSKRTTIKDFNGNIYVIPRYYRKKLIEQGYDIDAPRPKTVPKDRMSQKIEKAFGKPLYKIPSLQVAQYLREQLQISMSKVAKYNNQDKFI